MVFEDLTASLQEKWYAFLDWAQQRGLPFRTFADELEYRGIPSLPVFVAILIAIIGAAYAFVFLPLTTLPTTGVEVTLLTIQGQPLQNAIVTLASAEEKPLFEAKQEKTGSNGRAVFKNVPIGKVEARAYLQDFSLPPSRTTLEQNKIGTIALTATPKTSQKVSLNVQLKGTDSAQVLLFSTNGTLLENTTGKIVVSFNVDPNAQYRVKALAEGFSPSEKLVSVENKDTIPIAIQLYPKGSTPTGKVRVLVRTATGVEGEPITDAVVEVREASTGKPSFTLKTDKEGYTTAVDFALGTQIIASAKSSGYHARSSDTTAVQEDTTILVRLAAATSENSASLVVNVVDENSAGLTNAIVKVFDGQGRKIDEKTSLNGIASFTLPISTSSASVTAHRAGLLPGLAQNASGTITIILHAATSNNSGKLHVDVADEATQAPAAGAEVALWRKGVPLGIPDSSTAPDGSVEFQDLPLEQVEARAALNEKAGKSAVTITPGNQTLQVLLARGNGDVQAEVIDHFSQRPLQGAIVTISSNSCTTNAKGQCVIRSVPSGQQVARVTAPGFDSFESSPFNVQPNAVTQAQFHMIAEGVAKELRLEFQGVYDSRGKRVTSLSPFSRYIAKYVLEAPTTFNFLSATAHIRIGGLETALENEPAEIVGFDTSDNNATVTGGESYAQAGQALQKVMESGNATNASNVSEAQFAATDSGRNKWVEFKFDKFSGTREVIVTLQTKGATQTPLTLQHRSSFVTEKKEVLRSPPDVEAGTEAKPELQANTALSATLPISLKGECQNEYCLEWFFEGKSGTRSAESFDVALGEDFRLRIKSMDTRAVALFLSSDSGALEIRDAASGTTKGALVDREGRKVLALSFRGGEAVFIIRANRPTASSPLKLQAATAAGEVLFDKTLNIRVISAQLPTLRVQTQPSSLLAGQSNNATLLITDSQTGAPVTNATIAIGTPDDALKTTVQASPSGPGRFVAEEVKPVRLGAVHYRVQAEGYKDASGEIPVTAKQLLNVEPDTVTLSIDSTEWSEQQIKIENVLEAPLLVRAIIVKDAAPSMTELSLSDDVIRLGPKESKEIIFRGRISNLVLGVGSTNETLRETFTGRIRLLARTAGVTADQDVRFGVSTSLSLAQIDNEWSVTPTSLSLSAQPPTTPMGAQTIEVKSTANVPLLINTQVLAPTISVTPLSIVVPSRGTGVFTVQYAPPSAYGAGCVFDVDRSTASLELVASIQGIVSRKPVSIAVQASSADPCAPLNPVLVTLPFQFTLTPPVGFKTKQNIDGTTAVSLFNNRLLLAPPARFIEQPIPQLVIPAGALAYFPPEFVQTTSFARVPGAANYLGLGFTGLPAATLRFSLPAPAILEFRPGGWTQSRNPDGSTAILFSTGERLVYNAPFFPTRAVSGFDVLTIPPGVFFTVQPPSDAASNALIDKQDLSFDNDATITLPSGTTVERTIDGKVRVVFPSCQRADISTTTSIAQSTSAVTLTCTGANSASLASASTGRTCATYYDLFSAYDQQYGLAQKGIDPLVLAAIAIRESGCNPYVNAGGILQVDSPCLLQTPETVRYNSALSNSWTCPSPQSQIEQGVKEFAEKYNALSSEPGVSAADALTLVLFGYNRGTPTAKRAADYLRQGLPLNGAMERACNEAYGPQATTTSAPGGITWSAYYQKLRANNPSQYTAADSFEYYCTRTGLVYAQNVLSSYRELCAQAGGSVQQAGSAPTEAQTLPAAKVITFSRIDLQPGAIVTNPLSARIPAKSNFTVESCGELSDASLLHTFAFPTAVTITLPPGTILDGLIADLKTCQKVFADGPAGRLQLPESTRIIFPTGSTALGNVVRVPPGLPLSLQPCKPNTKAVLSATEGDYMTLAPTMINFTLSDKQKTDSKTICIYNNGTQPLKISPGPVDTALAATLPIERMVFTQTTYATFEIQPRPERPCYEFKIEAQLPPSHQDAYGCVLKDDDLAGQVLIKATDGKTTQTKSVTAKVQIRKDPTACPWQQLQTSNAGLNDFYINVQADQQNERTLKPMSLSFKDAGHSRPITLINNRPEPIRLSVTHATALASCDVPTELQPGEVRIIRCISNRAANTSQTFDTLEVTATGERTTTSTRRTVNIAVYAPPESLKALYQNTPWGELASPTAPVTKPTPAPPTPGALVARGEPAGFSWPVDLTPPTITSCFGPRGEISHNGADIRADHVRISAVADGTVIPGCADKTTCGIDASGLYVAIDHGGGLISEYLHLDSIAAGIQPGTKVSKGQTLGISGETGAAEGPHLHFAVKLNGAFKNPICYLPTGEAYEPGSNCDNVGTRSKDCAAQQPAPTLPAAPSDQFLRCEKHYCNYEQVVDAYSSFLQNLKGILDNAASNYPNNLNALCDTTAGTAVRKSIIIQKTNSKQTTQFLNSKAQQTIAASTGIPVTVTGNEAEISSCGIYEVRAQLNLLCGRTPSTAEEWRRSAGVEIAVEPLSSTNACPENLANTALLTAGDVEAVTGNAEADAVRDFREAIQTKTYLGGVHLGAYSPKREPTDEGSAIALSRAMYGTTPSAEELKTGTFYSDFGFCNLHGGKVLGTAAGALAADTALVFSGYGTVQAASAIVQTVASCSATTVTSAIGGTLNYCDAACDCAISAIASQMNFLFPGAAFGTRAGAIAASQAAQAGRAAAFTGAAKSALISSQTAWEFGGAFAGAGISAASRGGDPSATGTEIGVLAPQTARFLFDFRTRAINLGTSAGLSLPVAEKVSDSVLNVYKEAGKTVSDDELRTIMKTEVFAALNKDPALLQKRFPGATLNNFDDLVTAAGTKNLGEELSAAGLSQTITQKTVFKKNQVSQVNDLFKDLKDTGAPTGKFTKAFKATTVELEKKGLFKFTNRFKGSKIGLLKGVGLSAGIAALALTDCNIKPVQAELDLQSQNHIVAYTTQDGLASLQQVCIGAECTATDSLCPADSTCLALHKMPGAQKPYGYAIIAAGKNLKDPIVLYSSVFQPDTPPTSIKATAKTQSGVPIDSSTPLESVVIKQ